MTPVHQIIRKFLLGKYSSLETMKVLVCHMSGTRHREDILNDLKDSCPEKSGTVMG